MFTLRPATADDFDFLWRLHCATMRAYVAQTWGWVEAQQAAHFRENFQPALLQIIVAGGQDAGMVSWTQDERGIFLRNIGVAPEHQNQGIGSAVLRHVLALAAQRGVPVPLRVLKVNPARKLYERLGFVTVGETPTHFLMSTKPSPENLMAFAT